MAHSRLGRLAITFGVLLLSGCSLHRAAYEGNTEQIRSLLRAGADPNERGSFSEPFNLTFKKEIASGPPLTYAARMNHPEAVEALIDGGAIVDERDTEGQTALSRAIESKSEQAALVLIRRGADINQRIGVDVVGHESIPAILEACRRDLQLVVKELVSRGAYLDVSDRYETARMCIQRHHPDIQLTPAP